jgi:predicted protein tyrosine phosphatase
VFAAFPNIQVASAGTNEDAEVPISPELLIWADIIFVMERSHENKISKRFQRYLKGKRIICLNVPDEFEFMDPTLVSILKAKVPRFLSGG